MASYFRTIRVDPKAERPINNAALMGVRLYRSNLPLFDLWDARFHGDLTVAISELQRLLEGAKGPDAFRLLRAFLKVGDGPAPIANLDTSRTVRE
jgi:hypothetical protein